MPRFVSKPWVSHIGDTDVHGRSRHRLGGKRTRAHQAIGLAQRKRLSPLLHRLGGKEGAVDTRLDSCGEECSRPKHTSTVTRCCRPTGIVDIA